MCQTQQAPAITVVPSRSVKRLRPSLADVNGCDQIGNAGTSNAKKRKCAKCAQCKHNQRATGKYNGIITQCCTSCAETHDEEWHAAYIASTRCVQCKQNRRATAKCNDVTTQCCVSCAKVHDVNWYGAWFQSHACIKNGEHHCDTMGSRLLDGYCLRCFTKEFPDSPRVRWVRCKELAVFRALSDWFPNVTWVSDRAVEGGCSKRRPDVLADFGDFVLIIEVDEFQHTDYSCENKRMMEISRDLHHRPVVLIRFNPDAYTDEDDRKHKSPWSLTPKTKEPRVSKGKHTDEWESRLLLLRQQVEMHIANPPGRTITEVKLFYDN